MWLHGMPGTMDVWDCASAGLLLLEQNTTAAIPRCAPRMSCASRAGCLGTAKAPMGF